ncbi:hypothetical protein DV735_g5169, partial [Chaetothyriales sp. CBS 134920]
MSQQKPDIFFFSLGGDSMQHLFHAVFERLVHKIEQGAAVRHAGNTRQALDLLYGDIKPKAIFVTDAHIATPRNRIVAEMLVEFAQNGGTVVLGGSLSSMIRPPDMDRLFEKTWGLPWRMASYHRTTVALNKNADGIPKGKLPSSYSLKAVSLKNVDKNSGWYWPTEHSVIDSAVFAPDPVPTNETPVVFAKVANGWLGYIGDVNAEQGSEDAVLAMLGLS